MSATTSSAGLTCALPAAPTHADTTRTWVGPDSHERYNILRRSRSVAIVGASPNTARSSYFVATYLQQSSNFRVYFVNPRATELLGQPVYPDLASLPEVPDIVDVFRKNSDLPQVVEEAAAVGAKTVWFQLGLWNEEAAALAESKGLEVVMDRCMKIEHARFHGGLNLMGFNTGQIDARRRR
ncbi:CoA-binding protein [Mycetocola lacteus]|uniref:CoA-binding protein n=1 Tax=Mycetocola lacteus TaxID=76637 RepID=A0A3L7AZU7_9MICO|nr:MULTISPECIES: CoA-binding protein [Mycetocola]MCS4275369.1 putative CoA-binding protein [Mycetocola sp. BIGb0189]RLP84722.1 CoA-binding protein [Mycetocola lacteus]